MDKSKHNEAQKVLQKESMRKFIHQKKSCFEIFISLKYKCAHVGYFSMQCMHEWIVKSWKFYAFWKSAKRDWVCRKSGSYQIVLWSMLSFFVREIYLKRFGIKKRYVNILGNKLEDELLRMKV